MPHDMEQVNAQNQLLMRFQFLGNMLGRQPILRELLRRFVAKDCTIASLHFAASLASSDFPHIFRCLPFSLSPKFGFSFNALIQS
ncbi:hypothetical protein TK43_03935 [Roseovarius sp. JS7-11]|nr:hypothetical protein TK43_03935 [Roseovarius sp. JS7-11]